MAEKARFCHHLSVFTFLLVVKHSLPNRSSSWTSLYPHYVQHHFHSKPLGALSANLEEQWFWLFTTYNLVNMTPLWGNKWSKVQTWMCSTKHAVTCDCCILNCDCYILACDHCIWGAYWVLCTWGGGGGDSSKTLQLPPAKFCQLNFKFWSED